MGIVWSLCGACHFLVHVEVECLICVPLSASSEKLQMEVKTSPLLTLLELDNIQPQNHILMVSSFGLPSETRTK